MIAEIKKQFGFTLMEAVLYMAIVAILLTAVVTFHLTLGSTSYKLTNNILTSRSRRTAISGIDYLIKNSDGFWRDVSGNCSDFDATPPVLALYFSSSSDEYLPGDCVKSGGGVKISVVDQRIKMTCYPDVPNGYYQACDASVFAAGNSYFLTAEDVVVLNNSLSFATSTATTTSNKYTAVTTHLSVGVPDFSQLNLAATSTATSTVIMRNEQGDGLIAWWKFDDAAGSAAEDYLGNYDLTCTGEPTPSAGLINDSSGSFYFVSSESDTCDAGNPDGLNFAGPFSLSAWIKMDYPAGGSAYDLIEKGTWTPQQGFLWTVYYNPPGTIGRYWLRIFDGYTYSNVCDTGSGVLADDTVYNITQVYDPDNDYGKVYIYQKGAGGINTTTDTDVPTMVNDFDKDFIISGLFDGYIDEMRIYNRVLTDEEVWALQSQGEN